ncbi:hypothetical protein ACIF70_40515 [Actinacidiphila glaucinigra]|uniref:hypothetical protein n=1 Tax=Actinacidiphila glaucinigra TaxID=235986 RepID=UPI0037C943BF
MEQARFVVHEPSACGGRLVTMRCGQAGEKRLGTAFSDHDLLLILRSAGCADPNLDPALDDPCRVEWRGAAAHHWGSEDREG